MLLSGKEMLLVSVVMRRDFIRANKMGHLFYSVVMNALWD